MSVRLTKRWAYPHSYVSNAGAKPIFILALTTLLKPRLKKDMTQRSENTIKGNSF